jgi:hypothetical protein
MILFIAGLILYLRREIQQKPFASFWLCGTFLYLLLFFSLNVRHDYYQLPFLALISFFIAEPLTFLAVVLRSLRLRTAIVSLLMGLLLWQSLQICSAFYYRIDWGRVIAGNIIQNNSQQQDLIIAATPESDVRDPRLLYASRRHGFSIDAKSLTSDLLRKLQENGARYVAILQRPNDPVPAALHGLQFIRYSISTPRRQIALLYWAPLK